MEPHPASIHDHAISLVSTASIVWSIVAVRTRKSPIKKPNRIAQMLGPGLGGLRADTFQSFADSEIPGTNDASVCQHNARTRAGKESIWTTIRDQNCRDKHHIYKQNHGDVAHIAEWASEEDLALMEQSFGSMIAQMSSASFKSAEIAAAKQAFSSSAVDVKALWESILDVCKALARVHEPEGLNDNVHMSVNPENILYFPWDESISEEPAQTSSLREDFGGIGRHTTDTRTKSGTYMWQPQENFSRQTAKLHHALQASWACTCGSLSVSKSLGHFHPDAQSTFGENIARDNEAGSRIWSELHAVSKTRVRQHVNVNAPGVYTGNTVNGGQVQFGHVFHVHNETSMTTSSQLFHII